MLEELQIRNLALIEELNISFEPGLTVLSGETGAGKSIIIEALNLILGERADFGRIRSGCGEAVVQGLFNLTPEMLSEIEADEVQGELLLTRKLSANGKSRSYVNGSLTTLARLAEIGSKLIDFHGQHEHQSLLLPSVQREYLDLFGAAEVLTKRDKFARLMSERKSLSVKLVQLQAEEKDKSERQELLAYQIKEIDESGLVAGEDAELEAELKRLRHHERIAEALSAAEEKLSADETGAYDLLQLAEKDLSEVADLDTALDEAHSALSGLIAQLEEETRNITRYRQSSYFDKDKLDWLEGRVYLANELKRKYGGSLDAVWHYRDQCGRELKQWENKGREIAKTQSQISDIEARLAKLGKQLSAGRRAAGAELEAMVQNQLSELAMEGARFKVVFTNLGPEPRQWRADGMDVWDFFISTNRGEKLMPLAKIASGGEISRIMLALKTVLAKVDKVPVLIFDEIDAGIGGKTANYVGIKMASLAKEHQVICVTHLPRIAAYADTHLHVKKVNKDGRRLTTAIKLSESERVSEISRMLGGDLDSPVAAEHTKEFIDAARRFKADGVIV